jgi:hypothetical protein
MTLKKRHITPVPSKPIDKTAVNRLRERLLVRNFI